jgi:glycosyltransferase involved in cell wall biosynthesis
MVAPILPGRILDSGRAISKHPQKSPEDTGQHPLGPAILQVVPKLETGGAERSTIDIAAALTRERFLPLVASEGGRMVPELEEVGGELVFMPLDSKSPLRLASNALSLAKLIRRRNVKIIHARSRAPAWSALWAARRTGIPFVTTWHGSYSGRTKLKRFYNSVMARGDAVIANSAWTAEHIRTQFAAKRIITIPRGVDMVRFDPAATAEERVARLSRVWGVDATAMVVLLPGRLTRWKGQEILIEAVARLTRPDVRVVLAGDAQGRGAYEQELRERIAALGLTDRVIIAGHVSDMPAAYLAADIVVSASTQEEAFGRVAAEAAAMARPVIATDHGGARETVVHGETGLLVPPGDIGALATALGRLVTLGATGRADMGLKGREHIARNFTVQRMCEATLALYRELLAGPTPL